ncbi:ABC transporter substrate-binding protein [Halorussus sp. MSC15.2]|uniref:ABC transporter substrate-binding protein n=1 Tax=Halorussus sp. MSC15.2 TaxID=2283638 RepID=UPI0013D26777|nr:ABC transporter substrate-binding protein [Halorussus sp. MSC15.2]NEU58669.1 carbohydrate ABC transporter substrate-binding protein [Halorussus sp. MSC15.2]
MAQKQDVADKATDSSTVDRRDFLKATGAGAVATGLPGYVGFQGNVTLEVWLSYYTEGETKKKYTDQLVKKYQNQTGTQINVTGVPYTDVVTKFRSARAAGNVPHLVEVMTRPGILAGGAGMVVNDLWESSSLADKTSDKIMAGHRVWGSQSTGEQGNLVTFPLGFRPYLSAWRTDWLEQAGIDPSEVNHKAGSLHWYDDMPGIYDKLKQTDLGQQQGAFPDTTGMKQSDEEYMSLYIPQHGGSKSGVVNLKGTKATIDSEPARRAIKMQFDYIDQGYFHENSINHGDEESTTLHWSGQTAVNHIQDSTDLWGDYLEEQPQAMKNGAYTWGLPMNAGTKSALAWLPALGFIADGFSNQQEKDEAVKFIEWWVGDSDRAVKNAKNLGFVPVAPQQIQNEDFFAKTEMHKEFWRGAAMKTLKQFEPSVIPAVPGANAITYDIPRSMHQRISQMLGRGTGLDEAVNQATSQAAKEINQRLQQSQ